MLQLDLTLCSLMSILCFWKQDRILGSQAENVVLVLFRAQKPEYAALLMFAVADLEYSMLHAYNTLHHSLFHPINICSSLVYVPQVQAVVRHLHIIYHLCFLLSISSSSSVFPASS